MNILCTICSDRVTPAENIYVTHCGHIFHHHCLAQWIERSKSCPQCRNKVTPKSMFRLYPTVSNEANIDDAGILQTRLDDLQLKMQQQTALFKAKEKEIAQLNIDLMKNNETLASYREELSSKASIVSVLKERLKYMTHELTQFDKVNSENETLKKNIQTLNGLQQVLNATSNDVETMLKNHSDIKTLATFASALKRALTESEAKKVEYRNKFFTLKQQNSLDKMAITQLKGKLAESQEQLAVLERSFTRKRKSSTSANQSKDDSIKRPKNQEPADLDTAVILDGITPDTSLKENSESPYLNLKQSSVALSVAHRLQSIPSSRLKPSEQVVVNAAHRFLTNSSQSIFNKKPPLQADLNKPSTSHISYDGLGGHSTLDIFPKPRFNNKVPTLTAKHKLKRPASCQTITDIFNTSKEGKLK